MVDFSHGSTSGFIVVGSLYLIGLYIIAYFSTKKIADIEDFLVAGRRLSLPFATATLFATWFGAGTLLTISDEVAVNGMQATLLDPIGAGICLVLAGVFFARGLWEAKIMTLPDLFRQRFGKRVEILSGVVMVPTYFGWIAVQYIALAELLHIFTGLSLGWGIVLVAIVGMSYTVMGGMWAVTLTDLVQMLLVVVGLLFASYEILSFIGNGEVLVGGTRLINETPPHKLLFLPHGDLQSLVDAVALFTIGSLGNIPGQDLSQRICAARSARTAKWSCIISGILYLLAGLMPILIGLAAHFIGVNKESVSVVSEVAMRLFSGPSIYLFFIVILSVVLSTIDSATLSPASVMAQNVLSYVRPEADKIKLNQICIVGVTVISLIFAFVGESAYALLEEAYEMQLVGLFAPLTIALYGRNMNGVAMLQAIIVSCGLWLVHWGLGWSYLFEPTLSSWLPLPISLVATALGFVWYFAARSRLASKLSMRD